MQFLCTYCMMGIKAVSIYFMLGYTCLRNRRCSFRVLVRALVILCVTISFKVHRLIYHGIFWTCSRRKKNVQKLIYYNNTKCSQTVNKVLKDEELSTNAKDKLKHWVEWPCKKDNLSRRKYFLKVHFQIMNVACQLSLF